MIEPQATPFRAVLTKQQVGGLETPVIPEEMEDKWVLYRHKDRVRVHRSWTGYMIHEFRLAPTTRVDFEGGLEVVETWTTGTFGCDAFKAENAQRYGQSVAGLLRWLITSQASTPSDLVQSMLEYNARFNPEVTYTDAQRAWIELMIKGRKEDRAMRDIQWWMEGEA